MSIILSIDQIKETLSIVDVLSQYTNIKIPNPNRRSISVRCPFHSDGNASFAIYPRTNTFKCFTGCNDNRVGDVITVVMLALNVNHKEAIQILAKDFGLIEDGEKAEYYRSMRNKREEERKITDAINKRIIEQVNHLRALLTSIDRKLKCIKTVDDLDKFGSLYHLRMQIDYWLDCLISEDNSVKLGSYTEVERFLKGGTEDAAKIIS